MRPISTLVLAALAAASFGATLSAQWNFEGNLDSALAGGQPLTPSAHLEGSEPTADPTLTFTTDTIAGGTANVLQFVNNEWGNAYLVARHGIEPNGRGAYVNEYTIVMDLKVLPKSGSGWMALFNTALDTYNDADYYFRYDGADEGGEFASLGIGSYGGKVYWNQWNRIAITLDAANTTDGMRFFVNGALVNARSGGDIDGRWTLYSALDPEPWSIFFGEGDTSGDYAYPLLVSSVQMYDGVLTDTEIAALGGPTAAKLPGGSATTTVKGKIALEGYIGDATKIPITVTLVDAGGTTAFTKVLNLGADGSFSFASALTGTYRVLAKGPSFLKLQIGSATLSGGLVDVGAGTLLAGDIDNDNSVTVFDYNLLSEFFDKSSGDSDWTTVGGSGFAPVAADLDGDEAITVFDYNLLSKNFDQVGDE